VFGFACWRLAGRITAAQKAALQDFVDRMDDAIKQGDNALYYQLNLRFHDAIMSFTAHGRAQQTYESLIKETHLIRQSSLDKPERMRESNAEHAALVAALVAGDGEKARRLAEAHTLGGRRRWFATMTKKAEETIDD